MLMVWELLCGGKECGEEESRQRMTGPVGKGRQEGGGTRRERGGERKRRGDDEREEQYKGKQRTG